MTPTTPVPSRKKQRWSWYLYDFGNSAYAAVVLLAVYSAYFKSEVVGGARGSFLWGISVGIAMLVVALLSPILGSLADYAGTKKRLLFFYTAMACVFTACLFFVTKGAVVAGMALFILAEIGYRSAQVFYNSLLPEIASEAEIGRVSGNGWAIGSAGGVVCLVIVLALIQLIGGGLTIRLTLVFTAVYFAVFSAPIFLWLRERPAVGSLPKGRSLLLLPFKRIAETMRAIRTYREFGKFIIAFLVYNDGILMTLSFAAIMGTVLFGMEQKELILFMILVQITSVPGAFVMGWVTDRLGARASLLISLAGMLGAVMWLYFNRSATGFYMIGALAGFALTGVQSVSRAMVGLLAPAGRSAEFYGFFAVAGRTSSFIGPTVFGIIAARMAVVFQNRGLLDLAAEQAGQRAAILSIAAFLLVGTLLLLLVNERAGRAAASTR
ncbi:MFS transporter [Candidatus Bipolaricaulota bacterium]|nr:MFS transporter [Candidatus Bipolaricaulota bacterium]